MTLWPTEFGWGEPNEPGPQTEDSFERGFTTKIEIETLGHSAPRATSTPIMEFGARVAGL